MTLVRRGEGHVAGLSRPAWNPFEAMYEMMRWDPFQSLGGLASAGTASFSPSFDVKETEADLKNGVLRVRMPKKAEARRRRIRLFGRKSEKNEA